MSRIPLSNKKGSSTFIPDITSSSIAQYTPRLTPSSRHMEPRSPFTLPHKAHSNFITNTMITEGPRALSVSETGEKRQIDLSEQMSKFNTNPFISSRNSSFIIIDPTYPSAEVPSKIFENPLQSEAITENTLKTSSKKTHLKKKRSHHINLKPCLSFTPRAWNKSSNLTTEDSRDPLLENSKSQFNAQTQTETICIRNCSRSCQVSISERTMKRKQEYQQQELPPYDPKRSAVLLKYLLPKDLLAMHLQNTSYSKDHFTSPPLPPPFPPSLVRKSINRSTSRSTRRSRPQSFSQPRPRTNIKEFSELRGLAATMTWITVISIVVLGLFQVNGTREFLIKMWYNFKGLLLKFRSKPKSKQQMFTQFFSDFWI